MALLTRLLIFFLPVFMVGNIVHNTVFNMPDRNPIYHFYGSLRHVGTVTLFPMCLLRYFETGSCLFSRLRAVTLFHMTELLLYSLAYTAHLLYFNAFSASPLLGLLSTMLFSDFQNFFLAYISSSRPSVHHLRLSIQHSHRNFHGNAFSTNGNIDIGLLFPVAFSFLDSDCHEPHFSPV